MSATRCTCLGEFLTGLWIVLVHDDECLATHPVAST